MSSSFAVVFENDEAVFIIDLDGGGISVTNDAENVVSKILTRYGNKRIIYRDSDRNWDELIHDGSEFMGYRSIKGHQSINEVLVKLQQG